MPVLQSSFNAVKGLQDVRLAILMKRDPALMFQNQPFADLLQNRCS